MHPIQRTKNCLQNLYHECTTSVRCTREVKRVVYKTVYNVVMSPVNDRNTHAVTSLITCVLPVGLFAHAH